MAFAGLRRCAAVRSRVRASAAPSCLGAPTSNSFVPTACLKWTCASRSRPMTPRSIFLWCVVSAENGGLLAGRPETILADRALWTAWCPKEKRPGVSLAKRLEGLTVGQPHPVATGSWSYDPDNSLSFSDHRRLANWHRSWFRPSREHTASRGRLRIWFFMTKPRWGLASYGRVHLPTCSVEHSRIAQNAASASSTSFRARRSARRHL
jgi:hypothetical protein